MTEYVYEVIDASNDEMYFPLGIFLTLKDALDDIKSHGKEAVTEYGRNGDIDHEILKIKQRAIGWDGGGTLSITIRREQYYDEKADEYYWRGVGK